MSRYTYLVLDDMPHRHSLFCKRCHGINCYELAQRYLQENRGYACDSSEFDTHVEHYFTAPQAIVALAQTRYDVVSLDHDLGLDGGGNGMHVVDYICAIKEPERRPGRVMIHTENWVRGSEMMARLRDANYGDVLRGSLGH